MVSGPWLVLEAGMNQFGLGNGWLGKREQQIAKRHGVELINHTDPQCTCGHGCSPGKCKRSRRHWFVCQNLGEPFNRNTAAAVMAEIGASK